MKVSINIKLTRKDNIIGWNAVLKFKTNVKKIESTENQNHSIQDALKEAVSTSLDSIKAPCNIDVFANNLGGNNEIKDFLSSVEEIKKCYPAHIIKFYAS